MLRDADRRLLRHWQAAPGQTLATLAHATGMPLATVVRRTEKLREDGVVLGIQSEIDWKALGYAVEVSLRITLDKTQPDAFDAFLAEARKIPQVLELQTFLGRVDVRLTLIAHDMNNYRDLYRNRILKLPHIADIEALMQVAVVQKNYGLPL